MAGAKVTIPDVETPEEKAERLRKEIEERKIKEAEEARLKAEEEAKKAAEEEAKRKAEEEAAKNQTNEPTKIVIDDVEYTLNDNGDAVNEKGEIKYTKADIEAMEKNISSEEDDDYIESISKASGIVIKDETGNPVKFESTVDGFAKREIAIKELGEKEGFNKGFNKFLQDNPDIAALIDYKSKYGTIEGYSSHTDYSKVEIKDDDDFLSDLIYKAEIQKGSSPDRAKRIVEFAKNNNSLKEDALESLNWLKKNQEAEIKAIRDKEEADEKAALEQEIKFYGVSYDNTGVMKVHNVPNSIYDMIVVKGQIGDYSIPEAGLRINTKEGEKLIDRNQLFDYISRPVKVIGDNVYTQAQLDEMIRLSNPAELILRFIMNLDGGIDQLVKSTITKQEIKRLRSLSTKNNKLSSTTKRVSGKDDKIILPR